MQPPAPGEPTDLRECHVEPRSDTGYPSAVGDLAVTSQQTPGAEVDRIQRRGAGGVDDSYRTAAGQQATDGGVHYLVGQQLPGRRFCVTEMAAEQRTQLFVRISRSRCVLAALEAARDLVCGSLYDDGLLQSLAGEARAADHAAATVAVTCRDAVACLEQAVA